ncbi:nucleotidyltransferase family protein [Idiomarina sp. HP20-50]|uniref:nucleotidyltransferase family protein n=1 Tax=Idiomarina sp. HP20-50 TaxID=3070813 RepID=UPI00294B83DA|nr:nucleotidyltransferase family protein [Idiomarina sp. HP20-50]MDV6316966.1 nucleotidyltransferase family protein [Idiomarina sp. HP20-50]
MYSKLDNILLYSHQALLEALKVIDKAALRIAIVVDEREQLVGVVTDGDIRRHLIKGVSLNEPVSKVMNTNPLTAPSTITRKDAVKLMESNGLLALPLIKNGQVVGLETLNQHGSGRTYENPVFLMAGGFGTRLKPLTDNCPKPLLKVGDKPILEIVLDSFIRAGFKNFYISTHYLPQMIKDYFGDGSKWKVNITYVHEEQPLGTGGALGLLPSDVPDLPLFLMNGDVLTNVDFEKVLEFHNKQNAHATMCVRDYEYQVPFGVIQGTGNRVTNMVEKPVEHYFINAGIYIVSPELRRAVSKNRYIDMPSLLESSIEKQQDVVMYPVREYWLDIGRIEDYKRAQLDIINLDF